MRIGYQGEAQSYSHQAVGELFPDADAVGLPTFAGAFAALSGGAVDRLVLPIENSTTGSVLPVLDRLFDAQAAIVGEHRVEVRHALVGVPGTALSDIKRVRSHPEALSQAESMLTANGWMPVPAHDTAGAVREVAEMGDPAEAALAPAGAARSHGLVILMSDVVDREHNTTRFVVLAPGAPVIAEDADKSSVAFQTQHRPGALALALTELGLRGANLTRIESRPSDLAWSYRFFVDLLHPPGPSGLKAVFEPPLATVADFHHLGSYRAVR
jgi:prephenate dehydratase